MRIGAYAQIQQLYNTKKPNQVQKKQAANFADQVQISSLGKDIQTAKQAIANTPDIREELTAPLQSKVQNGSYDVDSGDFAAKLLNAYKQAH